MSISSDACTDTGPTALKPTFLHLLLVFLVAWLSPATSAEVRVSPLLDGWYRPGKYMPVRVHAPEQGPPDSAIEIRADGSATTRIEAQWGVSNVIAPVPVVH